MLLLYLLVQQGDSPSIMTVFSTSMSLLGYIYVWKTSTTLRCLSLIMYYKVVQANHNESLRVLDNLLF